jgi:hypothetical protein
MASFPKEATIRSRGARGYSGLLPFYPLVAQRPAAEAKLPIVRPGQRTRAERQGG